MKDNNVSIFDTRCIRFDKNNKYKIVYDLKNTDIILMRSGRFEIKNQDIVVKEKDNDFTFTIFNKGNQVAMYSRNWLMKFIKFKDSQDKCYCDCECNCEQDIKL